MNPCPVCSDPDCQSWALRKNETWHTPPPRPKPKKLFTTTFGFTAAVLSTRWYGSDVLEQEKARQLEKHVGDLCFAVRPVPTDFRIVLVDRSGPHLDGIEFEWVTEL